MVRAGYDRGAEVELDERGCGSQDAIRVFVAARVRLYREGLAALLDRARDIEVAGTAADGSEALAKLATVTPDVVIVDTTLRNGLAQIRAIVAAHPETRVIAFAVPDRPTDVIACAEAGVAGFVTRDASAAELVDTIRRAAKDEIVCSPKLTATLFRRIAALAAERAPEPALHRLTAREREIVLLIDEGLSNRQIAGRLQIELPTVKNHVHNILEKLHVMGRADAAARARAEAAF